MEKSLQGLKKSCLFRVTRPNLQKCPDPSFLDVCFYPIVNFILFLHVLKNLFLIYLKYDKILKNPYLPNLIFNQCYPKHTIFFYRPN